MAKYRKKPVVVEAVQWLGDFDRADKIYKLSRQHWEMDGETILIPTLEGVMRANIGDWIIKGVNGEFYPCKPDIFEQTYEKFE